MKDLENALEAIQAGNHDNNHDGDSNASVSQQVKSLESLTTNHSFGNSSIVKWYVDSSVVNTIEIKFMCCV